MKTQTLPLRKLKTDRSGLKAGPHECTEVRIQGHADLTASIKGAADSFAIFSCSKETTKDRRDLRLRFRIFLRSEHARLTTELLRDLLTDTSTFRKVLLAKRGTKPVPR